MEFIKKFIIFFLSPLVFLISFNAISQSKNQKVLNFLKSEMKENGIPGLQVAVVQNNELILCESLGLSNVPFSVQTEKNTIFSINSIAKIFTSTAIMQLAEKGKLQIRDQISIHLNDLPTSWQKVTIEQLLSHTSGLPDIEDPNTGDLIGGKGIDLAWEEVKKMSFQFNPGDEFSYNATNYLLLEKIIEKISGMDFEKFIKQTQFKVAGMDMTFYGNSSEVVDNRSPTYSFYYFDKTLNDYVLGDRLLEVYEEFPIKADAGAFSTAEEVAQWIISLQIGEFLSRQSINKMWNPVKLNSGEYGGFGGLLNAYAFGWPVIKREKHYGISAFGGGRASVTIYPEDNLSIILFTNLSGLPTFEITENISEFYLD
ncbi:serine hydrolase domain-containing protein [Ekhidna sp. To15]|uniref:serine hydrolase domain-containing protein n=1 Tax=Ekhidna sp. To15 TaxID=3395267 RepID=UPI003F520700